MALLKLSDVELTYPARGEGGQRTATILSGLDFSLRKGEFVSIVGRSGSGKTSLLNLAAGFAQPTRGSVTLAGAPITGPGADRAVVFQDDALLPWLSVIDNVALPLRLKGSGKTDRHDAAMRLLDSVGIAEHATKPIWALSGGQRQRVGIARALAAEPEFLLLDEPLGALDAMTRDRMQELLLSVWSSSGTGVLLITHGVEEALFLSTRVVVLAADPGRVVFDRHFDFGQRFIAGERARAIKADPEFIAAREWLITAIEGHEESVH